MNSLEFIKEVKQVIDSPEKWITETFAKTAEGRIAHSRALNACKFCVYGAFNRVEYTTQANLDIVDEADHMLRCAANEIFGMSLVGINDTLGFDAVHVVLDEAISQLSKKKGKK